MLYKLHKGTKNITGAFVWLELRSCLKAGVAFVFNKLAFSKKNNNNKM